MAANDDSPRSPPLNEQVPNNQRLGIEIPLGFPEHIPQQVTTPSPVAPNEDNDNFFGLLLGRCRSVGRMGYTYEIYERKYWLRCSRTGDYC